MPHRSRKDAQRRQRALARKIQDRLGDDAPKEPDQPPPDPPPTEPERQGE